MYKELLNAVKAKIDVYEKHKELSGENFNIFSIMSMESDEVFTHSAIIAELLNPNGSHSLGKLPLQLFIKQNFEEDFEFNFDDVKSLKEVFAGVINEDKTEGGRLDIVVINNVGQIFVIENKIYALEQKNQLLRYKNKYPEAKLFYLTLFGVDSKQQTETENNENYTAISYEKNILEWLEECVKYAYDKPMVREVLNQYIYLIKKLTNQTTNNDMKNDIIEIIKGDLKSSEEIYNNYKYAVECIQFDFINDLKIILKSQVKRIHFEIKHDLKKKEYSLHINSETFSNNLLFRFNKFNEAAIRIINFFEDENNNLEVLNNELKVTKFVRSTVIPKNAHYILEKDVTPFNLINDEKKERLASYSRIINDILIVLQNYK